MRGPLKHRAWLAAAERAMAGSVVAWFVLLTLAGCAPPDIFGSLPEVRASPTPVLVVAVVSAIPSLAAASPAQTLVVLTPPYDIGVGQHVSATGSFSATETEAAGPMICRIQRNSAAYRQLASNSDPRLLWNGGEPPPYNDEDHLMHPAALKPLNTLIELVATEWQGSTQVMVTAAYDSEGNHDLAQPAQSRKYSLHFEGRSLDLIPWPPDLSKMSRLCALAHAAGFDWVHNEQDHCHVSVKAQSLCELYDYTAGS